MAMSPETITAFLCQEGSRNGAPHDWDYSRARRRYRCKNCLVVLSKADLKELTDNA